jgi:two-component sensor histidine kinase/PAS domain-containing protein
MSLTTDRAPKKPRRPGAWPHFTTQVFLLTLVAAVVIPLLAFAAVLLMRYAATERPRLEREAEQIAGQVALVVDAELQRLLALLTGLSSSSALRTRDLSTFYGEATQVARQAGAVVVLRDFGSRQLINTQRPYGSDLPAAVPIAPGERANFQAGRPAVSGVYASPVSGEARIAIALALADGPEPYVLALTVPTTRIRDVVQPAAPGGWIIGVADRDGVFVTRSARHGDVTGKPGVPEYLAQAVGRSGTFSSVNFEGTRLLAGYQRSELSGWLVAANIPQVVVEAPFRRSLIELGALGAAALALSAGLALLFGRRLTTATAGLAQRAEALGEGRAVAPTRSRLTEFAVVGDALVAAAGAVEARTRERETSIEREALLSSIFDTPGLYVGIIEVMDGDFRFIAANRGTATLFGRPRGVHGATGKELGLPADEIRFWCDLARRCTNEGPAISLEHAFRSAGAAATWLLGTCTAFPSVAAGQPRMAFTAVDVTERKRGEEHRQLLTAELNHRVKNTLASVQALVSQTLRGATSLPEAEANVRTRLIALARAHDLLTRENWEGASLQDLAASVVGPHNEAGRITFEGPNAWVPPAVALAVALVLHELATNAAKFGALSAGGGTVSIVWAVTKADAGSELTVHWKERGGPQVLPPSRRGFGLRLIEQSLSSLGGASALEFQPDGVKCTIRVPLDVKGYVTP